MGGAAARSSWRATSQPSVRVALQDPGLHQVRDDLLDEEGVAPRPVGHRPATPSGGSPPSSTATEALDLAGTERLEPEDDGRSAPESQPGRDSSSSGLAWHRSSSGRSETSVAHPLEQVQQGWLGPVQVVDAEHQRAPGGQLLHESAYGPDGQVVGCRQAALPQQGEKPVDDLVAVVHPAQCLLQSVPRDLLRLGPGQIERVAQGLDQRPVGDALSVGDAPPLRHAARSPTRRRNSTDQSRLPDPRWRRGPSSGDCGPRPSSARERRPERGSPGPPDQRHRPRVAAGHGRRPAPAAAGRPTPARPCPWPHLRDRLDLHRVADQMRTSSAPSRISPSPAACSRRAAVLTASPVANEPPARADPATTDPVLTPVRIASQHALVGQQLLGQHGDRVVQLPGCPYRPQRVILVDLGDAEHGQHRVADELLDLPPVALDRRSRDREVAAHDARDRPRGPAARPSPSSRSRR